MARIAGVIGCAHPIALTEELINRMTHRGSKHKGVTGFHNVALGMSKFEKSEKDSVDLPLKIPLYEAVAAFDGILYNTLWKHSGISPAPVSEDEFIENMISNNNEILQSDGMYALAWATYRSQSIKLKRDRFGIKPLFWRNLENGQAFASEILPLVKLNQNISRIRQRSVAEFLAFGKALGSNTFYQGVYRVRPGSTVELSRDKKILVNNITVAMEQNISGSLRNALKTSIQRSLKPGRHIGLGISGGLDSTLLAFEMNAMGLNDIITVSLKIAGVNDGIDDLNSLDLPTNGSWNSWKHYAVSFSPHDFDEMMNRSVQIFGEPTKMTSVPLYIKLAEAAKACGIDVLIVGEGADEIFAGYPSYLEWIQKYRHGFSVYDSLQEFAFPAKRRRWLKNLLGEKQIALCDASFRSTYDYLSNTEPLQGLLDMERSMSLEPLLLRTDHCLTREGIEVRVPFLHCGIPDIAASLNFDSLFTESQTKMSLRNEWKDSLSKNIIYAPKTAFRAPIKSWLSQGLLNWLIDHALSNIQELKELGFHEDGVYQLTNFAQSDTEAASLCFGIVSLLLCLEHIVKVS